MNPAYNAGMHDIVYLIALCLFIWFWLDSRRAHEFALGLSRHFCEQKQISLLDESVALDKMRLRRDDAGRMQIERSYLFEYTAHDEHRRQGRLTLHGLQPVEIIFDGQRTLL